MKFNHCILEVKLEAQSPLIHFQPHHAGATLRASEVKPKLDRFLINKLCQKYQLDEGGLRKNYTSLFISKDHPALQYKLKIVDFSHSEPIDLDAKKANFEMYYGNSGKTETNEIKKGILSNPTVQIICFYEDLRNVIESSIEEFFVVTNFGTMQSKGFGSYVVVEEGQSHALDDKKVAGYLTSYTGAQSCFVMRTGANLNDRIEASRQILNEIKTFYSVMKSGQNIDNEYYGYSRSFLFQYMHNMLGAENLKGLNIGNEKAWMKKNRISPAIGSESSNHSTDESEYKYIRALFGIGSSIRYKGEFSGNETITIEGVDTDDIGTKFERISSPIFFKIIGANVYIIAKPIHDAIYGATFRFTNGVTQASGTLKTPLKDEFDIEHFLKSYVVYYNGALRELLKNIPKNSCKVFEVKINTGGSTK